MECKLVKNSLEPLGPLGPRWRGSHTYLAVAAPGTCERRASTAAGAVGAAPPRLHAGRVSQSTGRRSQVQTQSPKVMISKIDARLYDSFLVGMEEQWRLSPVQMKIHRETEESPMRQEENKGSMFSVSQENKILL
ncbi:uncharacterized protein LOC144366706 [Ictidomys tridecemlineatus]